MLVRATATIALDGWPPPTIEIHALLAALGESGHRSEVGPAQAFQHLNEVDLSFAFEVAAGVRADSRAQQIVLETMARIYGGPIHVHVEVVEVREVVDALELVERPDAMAVAPADLTAETGQPRLQMVVDLTAPAVAVRGEGAESVCAATGCGRSADRYDVRVGAGGGVDDGLGLTMALCTTHAAALGRQGVAPSPL
jgi:hypothetical protein